MQMRKEVKKEKRRVRREWCGKNWKWIVFCVIPGLILAIVLYFISISFIVSKLQQSTFFHLKLCVGFSIRKGMTKMVVPSNRCNSERIKVLDFRVFPQLKSIEIGDECFENTEIVMLIGLKELESVVIGDRCFTKYKNSSDDCKDPDRQFYLKNCGKVKELRIGCNSFFEYTVCEIENVDSLEVIEMKEESGWDWSFWSASLKLKGGLCGMEMMNRLAQIENTSFQQGRVQ